MAPLGVSPPGLQLAAPQPCASPPLYSHDLTTLSDKKSLKSPSSHHLSVMNGTAHLSPSPITDRETPPHKRKTKSKAETSHTPGQAAGHSAEDHATPKSVESQSLRKLLNDGLTYAAQSKRTAEDDGLNDQDESDEDSAEDSPTNKVVGGQGEPVVDLEHDAPTDKPVVDPQHDASTDKPVVTPQHNNASTDKPVVTPQHDDASTDKQPVSVPGWHSPLNSTSTDKYGMTDSGMGMDMADSGVGLPDMEDSYVSSEGAKEGASDDGEHAFKELCRLMHAQEFDRECNILNAIPSDDDPCLNLGNTLYTDELKPRRRKTPPPGWFPNTRKDPIESSDESEWCIENGKVFKDGVYEWGRTPSPEPPKPKRTKKRPTPIQTDLDRVLGDDNPGLSYDSDATSARDTEGPTTPGTRMHGALGKLAEILNKSSFDPDQMTKRCLEHTYRQGRKGCHPMDKHLRMRGITQISNPSRPYSYNCINVGTNPSDESSKVELVFNKRWFFFWGVFTNPKSLALALDYHDTKEAEPTLFPAKVKGWEVDDYRAVKKVITSPTNDNGFCEPKNGNGNGNGSKMLHGMAWECDTLKKIMQMEVWEGAAYEMEEVEIIMTESGKREQGTMFITQFPSRDEDEGYQAVVDEIRREVKEDYAEKVKKWDNEWWWDAVEAPKLRESKLRWLNMR